MWCWQIYDWYLEPNAGYYFMQRACEPLHVQLNLDDTTVAVVNRTYHVVRGLSVRAQVFSPDGAVLTDRTVSASADTASAKEVLPLALPAGVSFVSLELSEGGRIVSNNVYWMAPNHDFTSLRGMPSAIVTSAVVGRERSAREIKYTVKFSNGSKELAFFLNPQVWCGGAEVMPSFWSDNYFSLPPGESTTVTVSVPVEKVHGPLSLVTEGWN